MATNLRFQFGHSIFLSYLVVALIGAFIAVVYWVGINVAYSKLFRSEDPAVSVQTATPMPTVQPQLTTTPTPQPTQQPQQLETATGSNAMPARQAHAQHPRRKAVAPNYTEDILLGRKKGPPVNEK